jgi:hypothetical protein
VRGAFVAELRRRGHDPDGDNVFILTGDAAAILNAATNERRATNKASSYLKTLGIRELRKSAKNGDRGWVWHGREAVGKPAEHLRPAVPNLPG